MEEDYGQPDWAARAACRWFAYLILWSVTVSVCLFACAHVVMQIGGVFLAFVLAASLPLIFATLFETSYSRRARQDTPIICCPGIGAIVVIIGAAALQQASPLVLWVVSRASVDSPMELCQKYTGVLPDKLPRAVCVQHAFVKTDWEAGKLECSEQDGHVECAPEFAAAPIFNDKVAADAGLPKDIFAWGVTHGPHAVAAYRPDGSLCGYLKGTPEFDIYSSSLHLAVSRVLSKYSLALDDYLQSQDASKPAATASYGPTGLATASVAGRPDLVPLDQRPLLQIEDPAKMTSTQQAWLLLAVILLFFCPCVGPVPLGMAFLFWCWASNDDPYRGRRKVAVDDEDVEDSDTVALVKWRQSQF